MYHHSTTDIQRDKMAYFQIMANKLIDNHVLFCLHQEKEVHVYEDLGEICLFDNFPIL